MKNDSNREKSNKTILGLLTALLVLFLTGCVRRPVVTQVGVATGFPTPSVTPTCTLTPTPSPTDTPTPTMVPDPYNIEWWEETSKTANLAPEIISEMNKAVFEAKNAGMHRPDKFEKITADELKTLIASAKFPSKKYLDGKPITDNDKAAIRENRNLTMSGSKPVNVEYAIATSNASIRNHPTKSRISDDTGKFDYFQETGVYIAEPMIVLWKSKDGNWAYVQTLTYSGWMEITSFGYCSKEFFDDYCAFYFNDNNGKTPFKIGVYNCERAVVTESQSTRIAESLQKNLNPSNPNEKVKVYNLDNFILWLREGTILPMPASDQTLLQYYSFAGEYAYPIFLPIRDANGTCFFAMCDSEYNVLNVMKNISREPYNILLLAGKMLGKPYSWGDETISGFDCSSTVAGIYRCMDIFLPRNTGDQQKYPSGIKDISGLDIEAKRTYIMEQSAGTLLYFPGHVMMYLGEYAGKLYVLHNTTNVTYEDGTEKEVMSCVITTLDCGNGKQTYLERLTTSLDLMEKAVEYKR